MGADEGHRRPAGNPGDMPLRVGWVIGNDTDGTAVIFHTRDGGATWVEQGDGVQWPGFNGNDITAVDEQTAWAALGSADGGKILCTTDGGKRWVAQVLPKSVGPVKNIKALSRRAAWAAGLNGTVLHTTDGGETWEVVPHADVAIGVVNRLDAVGLEGSSVRIVDEQGGTQGMIHSPNGGATWRQETVPYQDPGPGRPGLHMVAAYSREVAWCSAWYSATLFRTGDGGDTWTEVATVAGPNDFDDMCAPTADSVWTVLNLGGVGGTIFHIQLQGGKPVVRSFDPEHGYYYPGMACADDLNAVAVGKIDYSSDPTVPLGTVYATRDGGETWERQALPRSDVYPWKVSFVGSRH